MASPHLELMFVKYFMTQKVASKAPFNLKLGSTLRAYIILIPTLQFEKSQLKDR